MKRNRFIPISILLAGFAIWYYTSSQSTFQLAYAENMVVTEMATALVKELNAKDQNLTDKYDVYITNFDTSDIPAIKDKTHKSILYMGGRNRFDINKVKDFDYIFTSTPDLKAYFEQNNIKSELLPPFLAKYSKKISKCVENPKQKQCYYVVIGSSEQVQTLHEKNIALKQYDTLTPDIINNIMKDAENISGLIMYNIYRTENSLDYSPLILKAMSAKIPVITDDKALQYYTQNIVIDKNIPDILQNPNFSQVTKRAYNFLELLTPKATAQRVLAEITGNKNYPLLKNTVSINGNTRLVDGFMSVDLQDGLEHNNMDGVQIYHVDSHITDVADIDIYMRGFLPWGKTQKNKLSIFYLYYPHIENYHINKLNIDDYIYGMLPELTKMDIVATASKKMAGKLKEYNINAYYIPQYTNPRRFYPEYHEELKTDVLFIGSYMSYRKAALTCLKHNIPISIYGPHWEKGIALKDYINNDELYKYYSSAKIVLADQRGEMTDYGFVANRIYDVTASGGFVISEYIPEIEEVYGDSIPMWKTEEELVELINYYLDPVHEAERQQKVKTARKITLDNFTVDKIGEQFKKIILENYKKI